VNTGLRGVWIKWNYLPPVTKCIFRNFGASGTIQRYDGLCVLPINTINDKIYITLWFWLLGLFVASCFFMVYRMFTICSPRCRAYLIKAMAPTINRKTFSFLMTNIGFGEWLLLTMMSNHMDIKLYVDILREIQRVSLISKRSVSTHIELIPGDGESEDDVDNSAITVIENKKSATEEAAEQTGLDPIIIQEMLADGYDPTQFSDWQHFRSLRTIGHNDMMTEYRDRVDSWRSQGNSDDYNRAERGSIEGDGMFDFGHGQSNESLKD